MNINASIELYGGGPGSGRKKGSKKAKEVSPKEPSHPWDGMLEPVKEGGPGFMAGGPGSGRKPGYGRGLKPAKAFSDLSPKAKLKVRKDKNQLSIFGPEHTKELQKLKAGVEDVEMEGKPIRPIPGQKRIVKKGTQFCVESDGVDKNFGCYPDRTQAEAVAAGRSFIEPAMKGAAWEHPTAHGKYGDITHYAYKQIRWSIDPETGDIIAPEDPKMEEERKRWQKLIKKANATFVGGVVAGAMPQTGWQYGKRTLPVGYVPQRTLSGFPSGTGGGRGGLLKVKHQGTPKPSPKPHPAGHHMTNPSMHKGTGVGHKFANPSMHKGIGVGHKMPNHSFKAPKAPSMPKLGGTMPHFKGLKSYADMGEPMAGALQHAHLDTNLWFHPPSLKNPDRIPTDDPGEKNNKFLDVTKRKQAHKDRMKLLKRGAPGGNPPLIPAHTTLLSPHQAAYTPGMMASARRRRSGGGMFRAFGSASI